MARSYDVERTERGMSIEEASDCIEAIVARINGVWDEPALMAVGPLPADLPDSIVTIIKHYGA